MARYATPRMNEAIRRQNLREAASRANGVTIAPGSATHGPRRRLGHEIGAHPGLANLRNLASLAIPARNAGVAWTLLPPCCQHRPFPAPRRRLDFSHARTVQARLAAPAHRR